MLAPLERTEKALSEKLRLGPCFFFLIDLGCFFFFDLGLWGCFLLFFLGVFFLPPKFLLCRRIGVFSGC